MIKNRGLANEEDIANELHGKRICNINPNLKTMLRKIFGPLDEEKTIMCERLDNAMKPDVVITYNNVSKYVSIKSGHSNSVHEEQMKSLEEFFKEAGLQENDINDFKMLLYRDGTLDGTGEKSLDYIESRIQYAEVISRFNERINGNKTFVEKMVNRALFTGAKSTNIEAEYIYFGSVNYGVLCSKNQVKKHISKRTWDYMENPHIGPLQFRAHSFNEPNDPQNKVRRNQCDFWWARLREDLEYIENRYWG